jgi:MraZ protein
MDRKGRVVMPAQFRAQLGAPFVLTRAPGQCLLALSRTQWDVLEQKYEQSVLFRGYYLSAAVECQVDATTGRFLIPLVLRDYSELRPMDEVAISGIGRYVQVARSSRWEKYLEAGEFPNLGQLDIDLELPRPAETEPYHQEVITPMGLPLVRCRGRMHGRAVRRLADTVKELISSQPLVVVLDLRQAGDVEAGLALVYTMTREDRVLQRCPLWVIFETELPPAEGVTRFGNIEDVLWRLQEVAPSGVLAGAVES